MTAIVGGCRDAVRAWMITPMFAGRRMGAGARVRQKFDAACRVWWRSVRVRLARHVCIPILGYEGLMANVLHVLEVVHRVRPDTVVHIDWVLSGTEQGFRYGQLGEDVWDGLFRPLGQARAAMREERSLVAIYPLDYALWGSGKDYLAATALDRHRQAYYRTLVQHIEVVNPRIVREVHEIHEGSLKGRFRIGVHRRVGNPMVKNVQRDGAVPSCQRLVECIEAEIAAAGAADWVVYLATDDSDAVSNLRRAFAERLVVRATVQRTRADATEVHYRPWGQLSLADAEDVLIDTKLLACCDVLLHTSSSISTTASLLNPSLRLVRVTAEK